jgi:hypothetical protein
MERRSRSDSNSRKLKSSEFLRLALRRAMMKIPGLFTQIRLAN